MLARRGVLLVFLVIVCALLAAIVVGMRLKITSTRNELKSATQGIEEATQSTIAAETKRETVRGDLETVRVELTAAQEESRSLEQELATLNAEAKRLERATEEAKSNSISEWEKIGDEAARVGDLEDAAEAYTNAIALDPKAAELFHKRGTVRRRLGDFADAIKDFEHALQLAPRYAPAMVGRGVALANRYKDIKPAIDGANRALRLNPELPVALDVRAAALFGLADYEGALRDDRRLIRLIDADTPMHVRATRRIAQAENARHR